MVSGQGTDRSCPLCQAPEGSLFFKDSREYFRCQLCALVFVLPDQFLTLQEEKAVYDLHENSIDDQGYRRFLARLFDPVIKRLPPESSGLDFGSGPGPTLSLMFEEAGHAMEIYDPFFAPEIQVLQHQYDFIVASEVVEHLHYPQGELDRLWSCLKPNGLLGIMTKRVIDQGAFARWHYKNDPTHVCFFSIDTFQWLADRWRSALAFPENDVVVFTKNSDSEATDKPIP